MTQRTPVPDIPSVATAPTILVIDDHRYVREMIRALFEREGYRVLDSGDGAEGLALAEAHRPDCVVLDVRMPGLSGFEVLERLNADPRTREIPVIMLTAVEDTLEGLDRALTGGAVDFLAKPVSSARVAVRVRGAIERRRLLQEVQELRSNFTSMLVHDLRAPITIIGAYVDMLGQGDAGPVTEDQRRLYGRIQESCGRLERLIGDVLELSKLEAGKLTLDRRPMDVAQFTADVVERVAVNARGKSIRLALCRPDDGRCVVDADETRLDQILMNLLGNALKFTPRGGSIDVHVARQGDEVEVTVTDSGPGIDEADLPLLFERFSRTTSARAAQAPGTGLGLVICRQLVEAHGGRIWAESAPDRGARFVVRLPAATG